MNARVGVMVATRDASWYRRPNVRWFSQYHVNIDGHPACNSHALLVDEHQIDAASIEWVGLLCQRPACKRLWSAAADLPVQGEPQK